MTKIISFINLKGGVGKTTLIVNIAAHLSYYHQKRVLVIDVDPQTNATVSLITQEKWKKINDEYQQTLFHLFYDKLYGTKNFDINQAILKGVGGIENLDLLPSSLNLVEIQDRIPEIGTKTYGFISHIDVLRTEIECVKQNYDFILIDCPPNLGSITLNGIVMSEYYLIPTTPDILSKIGISLVVDRIENFKKERKDCNIDLLGIIFTKVDNRTNLHKNTKAELRNLSNSFHTDVFKNELPQRISIAESPIDNSPHLTSSSAQQKQDWRDIQDIIEAITIEFLNKIP